MRACAVCQRFARLVISSADGAKDKDGYSIVIVQATGHHTGKAFSIPGSDLHPVSIKHPQPSKFAKKASEKGFCSVEVSGSALSIQS
jgi:hypothetical protein